MKKKVAAFTVREKSINMQPYFSIGRLPVMRDGDVTETKVANIFILLRKQVLHIIMQHL